MQLHFQTAAAVAVLVMLLNGAILGFMHNSISEDMQEGARDWRIATLLCAGGVVLLAVQELLPAWLVFPTSNLLFTLAWILYWRATRRLRQLPDLRWPFALPLVVGPLLFVFSAIHPSFFARVVLMSLSIGALAGAAAWTCFTDPYAKRGFSNRALGILLAIVACFMAIRLVHTLISRADSGTVLNTAHPIDALVPLVLLLVPVIGTTAFILQCVDRLRQRWEYAANTDELTELPNRRAVFARAERMMVQMRAKSQPLTAAIIDLDHFKAINDTHGHAVGDQALKHAANQLRALHKTECLGRIGGEEFVLLLPGQDAQEAHAMLDALRLRIASVPLAFGKQQLTLSASIGYATLAAADHSFGELLVRADHALYAAKTAGRNYTMRAV